MVAAGRQAKAGRPAAPPAVLGPTGHLAGQAAGT